MGMEYRIAAIAGPWPLTPDDTATLLRSLTGFAGTRASDGAFEFRAAGRTDGMPDLEVRIEPAGLYLCDFGGDRTLVAAISGAIVLWCAGRTDGGIGIVPL